MNITVTKIKRELQKQHGWENLERENNIFGLLIKDTIKIINDELIKYKNITIKK